MSTRPFRFVHASDFHLEQPLMGVADVPDHLRNVFLDAPYHAAAKVFETAVVEDAEFVLLSGDILQSQITGPRGPLFLIEQFNRLAARGIDIYWAGGSVDLPEGWPAALAMPKNVHVFPLGQTAELTAECDVGPLARLVGVSRDRQRSLRPSDFAPDPAGLYSIAIAHGDVDPSAVQASGIHYWALGGRHERSTPLSGPHTVHYCGSPQGRRPEECGVHGCTLVQVDGQGQTRTAMIPTDAARWFCERVAIDETTTREELEGRIRDRISAIVEASSAVSLLISWIMAGHGPLMSELRRGKLTADLLESLRSDFGYRSPAAWTVSLDVELSETLPPEWYEQETIRGDFLRAVRQLQMNPDEPIALDSYMAEAHLAGTLGTAVGLSSKAARDRVLREAAALGVDLLSGEEPHA